MELKDILRELRNKNKLTQSELADKLGLKTNTYQSYEHGNAEPSCSTIKALADFYGVTTDYLLGREPAPDPFADLGLNQSAEKAVLECYMLLDQKTRAILLDTLRRLASEIPDPEPEESPPEIVETTTIGAELDRRASVSDAEAEETAV